MSSFKEKEKRIRPKNNPYKRDHFDQTKYLRVSLSENSATNQESVEEEFYSEDEEQY